MRNHVSTSLRFIEPTLHPALIWQEVLEICPMVNDDSRKVAEIHVVQGLFVSPCVPLILLLLALSLLELCFHGSRSTKVEPARAILVSHHFTNESSNNVL